MTRSPNRVLQLLPSKSYQELEENDDGLFEEPPAIQRAGSNDDSPWLKLHLQQQTVIMQEFMTERKSLREENQRLQRMLHDAEVTIHILNGKNGQGDGSGSGGKNNQQQPPSTPERRIPLLCSSPSLDDQSNSSSSLQSPSRSRRVGGGGGRPWLRQSQPSGSFDSSVESKRSMFSSMAGRSIAGASVVTTKVSNRSRSKASKKSHVSAGASVAGASAVTAKVSNTSGNSAATARRSGMEKAGSKRKALRKNLKKKISATNRGCETAEF